MTSLTELKESVAHYITRAAEKLREQKQVAAAMNVFTRTSRHIDDPQVGSMTIELQVSTNDTSELLHYGMRLVEKMYRKGIPYKKAGVLMMGLQGSSTVQISLFDIKDREKNDRLMKTLDQINDRYGSGTLKFAVEGIKKDWIMRCENRSGQYTTSINELPIALAEL